MAVCSQMRSAIFVLVVVAVLFSDAARVSKDEARHSSSFPIMSASVAYDGSSYQIVVGIIDESAAAYGSWDDAVNTTGWGFLTINTCPKYDDAVQAYAAGYLEGYFTWQRMRQFYTNYVANEYGLDATGPTVGVSNFLNTQRDWIRSQVTSQAQSIPYWRSIGLLMQQFDGLVDGAALSAKNNHQTPLTELEVYVLSSAGDLETINGLFHSPASTGFSFKLEGESGTGDIPEPEKSQLMDCSALIRILPNQQDIVVGHTTWRYFYGMLRVSKSYSFAFQDKSIATGDVIFSSSPGFLSSKDDFYTVGSGLVTLETTNDVFNGSLYTFVTPQSVMVWQRVVVANWMASSGKEWTSIFSQYNSGTYNNQWMVVDTNVFYQKPDSQSDILWIAEQIPGTVASLDVTPILQQQQFWSSYNIPYQQSIYEASGYPAQEAKYGAEYSYADCSRAQIFRRNATMIENMEQFKQVMQYNGYKNDPLSGGNPVHSISARADLPPVPSQPNWKTAAFGGVDSKVTSMRSMMQGLQTEMICGPTTESVPVFCWTTSGFDAVPHEGLPDCFDFDWQTVKI